MEAHGGYNPRLPKYFIVIVLVLIFLCAVFAAVGDYGCGGGGLSEKSSLQYYIQPGIIKAVVDVWVWAWGQQDSCGCDSQLRGGQPLLHLYLR